MDPKLLASGSDDSKGLQGSIKTSYISLLYIFSKLNLQGSTVKIDVLYKHFSQTLLLMKSLARDLSSGLYDAGDFY